MACHVSAMCAFQTAGSTPSRSRGALKRIGCSARSCGSKDVMVPCAKERQPLKTPVYGEGVVVELIHRRFKKKIEFFCFRMV